MRTHTHTQRGCAAGARPLRHPAQRMFKSKAEREGERQNNKYMASMC